MLKGKATIQLFDGETGKKVHEQTDHNLVTNAIYNLLNPDFDIKNMNTDIQKNIWASSTPMYNKLLRGVLLFDDVMPEDPDCIIPPSKAELIGHAGSEYSGTDLHRGTYNTNESGAIENGWRHVFDFATDKANGIIKSVALTSLSGGNAGFYFPTEKTMLRGPSYLNSSSNTDSTTSDSLFLNSNANGKFVCNPKDGIFIFASLSSSAGTITFNKFERNYKKHGLGLFDENFNTETFGAKLILSKTYSIPTMKGPNNYDISMSLADIFSYALDGDNLIVFSTNGRREPLTMMKSIISIETLELSSSFITLDKEINNSVSIDGQSTLFDNKIYTLQGLTSEASQPKVDVFTSTGTWLETKTITASNLHNMRGICTIGDWICFGGAVQSFRGDKSVSRLHSTGYGNECYIRPLANAKPPYYAYHVNGDNARVIIFTPYLGTIDNLATPITKTDSQTMKVIYDIVETV